MAGKRVTVRERKPKHIRADFTDPKNPESHVKLVRDTPKRRQYHERMGYVYTKPEELADHDGTVTEDGRVMFGDRVAMTCPKADVEARNDDRHDEWRQREASNEAELQAASGGNAYNTDANRRSRGKMVNIPADYLDE